ncbi:MAG: hypothetical protein WAU45_09285 [Blastocatellia bacterium]
MQWRTLISPAVAAAFVCIAIACNRQPAAVDDPDAELSGEPEQFSATIVHAVDDGVEREINVTRIFKSGNLRREEWIEQGESLALIWRPDLGKTHLLDIEGRCYVESDITPNTTSDKALKVGSESTVSQDQSLKGEPANRSSARVGRDAIAGEAVDRAFDRAPSPVHVENRRLADQTIDGHPCAVAERREIFAGNHTSVTTTFRARDLNGLAIRIEMGLGEGTEGAKLITKWRDIRRVVSSDVFAVPPDFRRVDKLPR